MYREKRAERVALRRSSNSARCTIAPNLEPNTLVASRGTRSAGEGRRTSACFFQLTFPLSRLRFINWSLRNQYDDKGELILPRPRGSDKDEEMFLAYVSDKRRRWRTSYPDF